MKKFFICISFCLFAGCVGYRPKPLSPAETARAFEARSLEDPNLARFIGANRPRGSAGWDLDALVLTAFYYHSDLDLARAQWNTARAGEKTAAERPNPTLALGPVEWVSNPDAGLSPWIAGFSFDIPIETAGKRGARRRQAAAGAESARQNLAWTAWQVRARVRSSLLALSTAAEEIEILRRQDAVLSENARLLSDRSRDGRTSPLSAEQAEVLARKNGLALQDAFHQEADARSRLAEALGVPLSAVRILKPSLAALETLPDPEAPAIAEARRTALLGRSDLLSALADYAAAEAALELEIDKQYPDIHLGPGFTYDQGQDKWGIGVTIPLPVLSRNRGPISEAESRRQEAAARFLALQEKVIDGADQALALYHSARRKLRAAGRALSAQERQSRSLGALLRPGDVSYFARSRLRLDLAQAELARAEALKEAREAAAALEDVLEHPLWGAPLLPAQTVETDPREAHP